MRWIWDSLDLDTRGAVTVCTGLGSLSQYVQDRIWVDLPVYTELA